MRRPFAAIIVSGLFVICSPLPSHAKTVDQILHGDKAVRLVLGSTFDVLRVEPVAMHPSQIVVDAATQDRAVGIRALVDTRTSLVVRVERVDTADILYAASDVEKAFAIVKDLPSIRTLLGSAIDQYRASGPDDPDVPAYKIDALPVRGMGVRDECALHRCLDLLFRTPHGYLQGPHVLVDLTSGKRIGGPANESPTRHPSSASTGAITRAVMPDSRCQKITFPNAPTSWNVCWHRATGFGIVIGPATFKRGPFGPFGVIGDARVDQIFVPYATGQPRYYDVNYDFPLAYIPQSICPGTLLERGTLCLEIRDRDVDWLFSQDGSRFVSGRRGQEAVLWSVLAAANYQYIQEWGFRDDGVFWGRAAATGRNLPGLETESHTHDFIWRIAPQVGPGGDSVNHVTLNEPVNQPTAQDTLTAVPQPAGLLWSPQTFDQLEIYPPGVVNGRGDQISYRLVPLPTGGLAHHEELFTQADLWATAGDPTELDATMLPQYAHEQRSLVDTSVTMWYRGSIHHQPRDEDGYYGNAGWFGTTHTMWTGFMFVPRNLFDKSPLFP